MSRFDELKGQIKQGIGSLTGNKTMKREGEAEATRAKVEREVEGAVDQAVGKAQQTLGSVTDDAETEAEGKVREAEGDVKRSG